MRESPSKIRLYKIAQSDSAPVIEIINGSGFDVKIRDVGIFVDGKMISAEFSYNEQGLVMTGSTFEDYLCLPGQETSFVIPAKDNIVLILNVLNPIVMHTKEVFVITKEGKVITKRAKFNKWMENRKKKD